MIQTSILFLTCGFLLASFNGNTRVLASSAVVPRLDPHQPPPTSISSKIIISEQTRGQQGLLLTRRRLGPQEKVYKIQISGLPCSGVNEEKR